MDLQSLEAFLAVVELGSFSKAGEKLFLTQPAISKRISNLETQLGAKLFDRIGRDVYVTEAGEILRNKAEKIVNDIRDTQFSISQLGAANVSQLSLASSHHVGLHYLGPILRDFMNCYPGAKVDLKFMESEQTISSLLKREIELAITTIPVSLSKDLSSKTIWRDDLHFVIANDHSLAGRQDKIRLNELVNLTAILPDRQTTTFQIIEKTFARHHIPLKRVISVNYLETIRALVSHGLGWSLLPTVLLNDSLTVLNIDRVSLHRNLGVITHRQRTLSYGGRALIEAVEAHTSPADR